MKRIAVLLSRYRFFLLLALFDLALLFCRPALGVRSFSLTWAYVLEMLSVVPPIFILMGLMDVWIPKETMMKYMGKSAGCRGGFFAFLLGAFSSGPLYAAFPMAGMLIKKGVSLTNVFLFLGAWSTAKIPMMLFEVTQLGSKFAGIRFVLSMLGIVILAFIMEKTTNAQEQDALRERICALSDD